MQTGNLTLTEGAEIKNLTVPRGGSFPSNPNEGELFYKNSNADGQGVVGIYVYTTSWELISVGATSQGLKGSSSTSSTSSATLTDSDYGKITYYNSTSAGTLTLPTLPSTPTNLGSIITIYNLSSGSCTVARAGSNNLYAAGDNSGASSSIVLKRGESISLSVTAGGHWVQVGASNGLGYGQTYADVTGSRALATTYYTTNKPKVIMVLMNNSSNNSIVIYALGGVSIQGLSVLTSSGTYYTAMAFVPAWTSYAVNMNGTPSLVSWHELS